MEPPALPCIFTEDVQEDDVTFVLIMALPETLWLWHFHGVHLEYPFVPTALDSFVKVQASLALLQHQAMRVQKQTCTCEALTSVNGATLTKQCAAEIPA